MWTEEKNKSKQAIEESGIPFKVLDFISDSVNDNITVTTEHFKIVSGNTSTKRNVLKASD